MTHQTIRVPSQVPLSDRQPEVQQTRVQAHGRWFNSLPALAGIGYGIAWVVGLAAWPSKLAIDASEKEIVTVYATHMSQAATQYLLVEGLAGVLLGMVLLYCLRHAVTATQHGQPGPQWRQGVRLPFPWCNVSWGCFSLPQRAAVISLGAATSTN